MVTTARRTINRASAMTRLDLQEYQTSSPYDLTVEERDALVGVVNGLILEPVAGESSKYTIRPGSWVGAVEIGDLSVLIQPKVGIVKLLALACYAMGMFKLQHERQFDFAEELESLPDTLALALAAAARRAFSRGLLHGYLTEEEALLTVRGRIRFDDQLRRRFGLPLPIEVTYDEFTDDIVENRLVKAAVVCLGEMRLRSSRARRDLGWIMAMLENVSHSDFTPKGVPEVSFNRLNEHYRVVVGLSRLILQNRAFESRRGEVRATGFLMDMNKVFQDFVTVALREELGISERVFCSDDQLKGQRRIHLDEERNVKLEPDLTWWEGGKCVFVGDAKYKVADGGARNADLYQLLAYATALDLPGGMLIYAKGETKPVVHQVMHVAKQLEVAALDLSGTLDDVLDNVARLAHRVRELRSAVNLHSAARSVAS